MGIITNKNALRQAQLDSHPDKGGAEESFLFLKAQWKIPNQWLKECQQKISGLVAIFPEFDFCQVYWAGFSLYDLLGITCKIWEVRSIQKQKTAVPGPAAGGMYWGLASGFLNGQITKLCHSR